MSKQACLETKWKFKKKLWGEKVFLLLSVPNFGIKYLLQGLQVDVSSVNREYDFINGMYRGIIQYQYNVLYLLSFTLSLKFKNIA